MMSQISTLSKLELINLFGFNVFRYNKDKKAKRKSYYLIFTYILLIAVLFSYIVGFSYGLIQIGQYSILPAYIITIISLIILFFDIFKIEGVLFSRQGYEILSPLPIYTHVIVISRFISMYVENIIISCLILLPGLFVYGYLIKPDLIFYFLFLFSIFFIPLIPMALAIFIGTIITGISSRMKHKNFVSIFLSISVSLFIIFTSSKFSSSTSDITIEMLTNLSDTIMNILKKLYPFAVWLGFSIINKDIITWFLCISVSLIIIVLVLLIVSKFFQIIYKNLYSTYTKNNYKIGSLKKESILFTLTMREFRRYFSSSIYVTNTIISPIMALGLSIAIYYFGFEVIFSQYEYHYLALDLIPFIFAGAFCMMNTTSTSISLEGKNWWILKSLPLTTKEILDAKILMNLILYLPFFIVSQIFLILALTLNLLDLLWLILIPTCLILLSCVLGISINLKFPVFNWKNEVSIVKQSTSSLFTGMGGLFISIIFIILLFIVPNNYTIFIKIAFCIFTLIIAVILYFKNNQTDLKEI